MILLGKEDWICGGKEKNWLWPGSLQKPKDSG